MLVVAGGVASATVAWTTNFVLGDSPIGRKILLTDNVAGKRIRELALFAVCRRVTRFARTVVNKTTEIVLAKLRIVLSEHQKVMPARIDRFGRRDR